MKKHHHGKRPRPPGSELLELAPCKAAAERPGKASERGGETDIPDWNGILEAAAKTLVSKSVHVADILNLHAAELSAVTEFNLDPAGCAELQSVFSSSDSIVIDRLATSAVSRSSVGGSSAAVAVLPRRS